MSRNQPEKGYEGSEESTKESVGSWGVRGVEKLIRKGLLRVKEMIRRWL